MRELALQLKRSQTTLAAYLLRAQEGRAHPRGPPHHQAARVEPTWDQELFPLFAATADREGWPTARFLAVITAHELAERANRRIERHPAEAHLGRAVETFVAAITILRRSRNIVVWLNLALHDGGAHRCFRLAKAVLWLGSRHIPTRSCLPKTNGGVQRDMQILPHEIA